MSTDKSGFFDPSQTVKTQFTNFLQKFTAGFEKQPKYLTQITRMLETGKHLLIVEYQDFVTYIGHDTVNLVFEEYYKYQPYLNSALTSFIKQQEKKLLGDTDQNKKDDEKEEKYEVTFDYSINHGDQANVRDLRCNKLGKLFSFRGTVTRTTEVRPQLVSGIFRCKICGAYSKPVIQQFKYTEPKRCSNTNCDMKLWELDLRNSQFADFQKLRVQEDPTKIPPGAMPRSIDIILRNQNTQKGQPGDICKFVGYLCVLPEIASMLKPGQKTTISTRNIQQRGQMMEMEGVRGIKGIRELNYRLIFIATNVVVENNQFRQQEQNEDDQEYLQQIQQNQNKNKPTYDKNVVLDKVFFKLSRQELKIIAQLKQNPKLYQDMANSLFPSIFGHDEIKKALLLQLFGGIHKITQNKISIRGDINILIVGDPSTAKSQFLKAVNKFVPRSVYTNGKTTSAAGLTATVTKDEAGTVSIEAGALMLADNGICCIDEFDKMNYSDQTAIHEAMQQQTISIAKAGVYATLNARTSILAAANPLFGRYDKTKSLKNNINISSPIMSRFDLFFVVCDDASTSADINLSEFIINMHRNKDKAIVTKYDTKSIKLYISTAKKIKPMISAQAGKSLRKYYTQMRQRDNSLRNVTYKVTVRQLQSMIRISQALARLKLDTEVKKQYVEQAYRLISSSVMKLQKSAIMINPEDPQEIAQEENNMVGITEAALQKTLNQKIQEKKHKPVTIAHEAYQAICKNIVELYKETERRQNFSQSSQEEVKITQQAILNYVLGIMVSSGQIQTEEQINQTKKVINAIIKKLIKEERVLMIVEDNPDQMQRELKLHPNFSF